MVGINDFVTDVEIGFTDHHEEYPLAQGNTGGTA
jgi:hypothetical protein